MMFAVAFVFDVLRVLVSRLIPMEAHRPVNPPAPPPLVLTNMFNSVIIKDPHDSKFYLRMCIGVIVASACVY